MKRSALALPVLAVTALLVPAACGDDDGDTTTPGSTPTPAVLAGRTFLSTATAGFDLVAGTRIRLTFDDAAIGASAGCNSMGGDYTIIDGRLQAGPLNQTEMACDPPLMAQDERLADLLTGRPLITLADDTLLLSDGSTTVTLRDREVVDPDRPLEGTAWTVTSVIEGEVASAGWGGAVASLRFRDGRLEVDTGCNTGSAAVTLPADPGDRGTITVGALGLTKIGCDEEATRLERAVVSVLAGEVRYTIEASILRLSTADGAAGLELTAEA
jgi:heat shock protein HslJ